MPAARFSLPRRAQRPTLPRAFPSSRARRHPREHPPIPDRVSHGMSFAQVALPLALRRTFTYRVPEQLAERVTPGVEVQVPFRGRVRRAFVVELARANPLAEGTATLEIAAVLG